MTYFIVSKMNKTIFRVVFVSCRAPYIDVYVDVRFRIVPCTLVTVSVKSLLGLDSKQQAPLVTFNA